MNPNTADNLPENEIEDARFDHLGEVVRKIRVEKNLTQTQVAEALHVTPGYISNVENGRTCMSLKVLVYYAELTSTSLDTLVGLSLDDPASLLDRELLSMVLALSEENKKKLLQTVRIWFPAEEGS